MKVSLFYLDAHGTLNVWPQTIADQLSRAGYPPSLVGPYEDRLREVMSAPKTGGRDLSRPVTAIDVDVFLKAVDEFVGGSWGRAVH